MSLKIDYIKKRRSEMGSRLKILKILKIMMGLCFMVMVFGSCEEGLEEDEFISKEVSMSFAGGDGSKEDPYRIANAAQLRLVAKPKYMLEKKHFIMIKDIDLRGVDNFKPIEQFEGVFDGNGKKIKNLKIHRESLKDGGLFSDIEINGVVKRVELESAGFFGKIGVYGVVKNLGLEDVDMVVKRVELEDMDSVGLRFFGGLAGDNAGTIENSYVTGKVRGEDFFVGGLVGFNNGKIEGSYMRGDVLGNSSVGGLVGYNAGRGGRIANSYVTGNVEGDGYYIGGLVGFNAVRGKIEKSYTKVDVKGRERVGGLVGINLDVIKGSYARGRVEGEKIIGGFAGGNIGTIQGSHARVDVEGIGNDHWIGGFVGGNIGEISKSYATGDVLGKHNVAGGLVGMNFDMIEESYATGRVEGGNNVGGLVGWNGKARINLLDIGDSFIASGNDKGQKMIYNKMLYRMSLGGSKTKIANSYATGRVEGRRNIGGLVGYFNKGTIEKSYATGDVSGKTNGGGFVGWHLKGKILSKNYWKGGSASRGVGLGSGGNVEGKTGQQLRVMDAVATGWDSVIWDFQAGEYPKLQWQR